MLRQLRLISPNGSLSELRIHSRGKFRRSVGLWRQRGGGLVGWRTGSQRSRRGRLFSRSVAQLPRQRPTESTVRSILGQVLYHRVLLSPSICPVDSICLFLFVRPSARLSVCLSLCVRVRVCVCVFTYGTATGSATALSATCSRSILCLILHDIV